MPPGSPRPRPRPRRRSPSVLLTERDRALLAFAGEHRFVLAAHVAVSLQITSNAAAARMRALTRAGYLCGERKLRDEPTFYQVTRDGIRAVGGDLPRPRPIDYSAYRHDIGLCWLTLAAGAGRFGPLRGLVGERRMRSHDGRAEGRSAPLGVRLGGVGPGGRERLHYPDLLLVTASGHRVALELELSGKGRERRERILAGYASDRRIDAVVYLVSNAATGRAVSRSAARLGIGDLVSVQGVAWDRPPEPGDTQRTADRHHARAATPRAHDGAGDGRTGATASRVTRAQEPEAGR